MDSATAQRLFNAYREGLLNREGPNPKDYQPRFQVLLLHLTYTQFSLAERLYIRKARQTSAQALALAREGRLQEATECINYGRDHLTGVDRLSPARLMAESTLESANAYLDYRTGHYEQARRRLLAAMDADLVLEQNETFGLLEIHRIQSALNLMRLELRSGQHEKAFLLAGRVLAYLENLDSSLPVHHSWRSEALIRVPRAVRRAMVTQVGNDTALALLKTKDPRSWPAFCAGLRLAAKHPWGPEKVLHQAIQQWVCLKQVFEQQDWDLYQVLLADFLPAGRRDVAAIWYASVIDFLHFCKMAASRASQQVYNGILRDSQKWPALPPLLRECIENTQLSAR
ncbi:MAG: hypothetical protein ABUT39_02905 [Acidobacteriota bacterium]